MFVVVLQKIDELEELLVPSLESIKNQYGDDISFEVSQHSHVSQPPLEHNSLLHSHLTDATVLNHDNSCAFTAI